MTLIKYLILILIGFSSGTVIAGAVFAFIAIIGVVPRFAQKTNTQEYVKLYEQAVIVGGIFGTTTLFIDYFIPLNNFLVIFISLSIGVFYGALAVSLTEVLDVIPILTRRTHIKRGLKYFLTSVAFGKLVGSALYYFVPGFYEMR